MRGEVCADDRREVGESGLGESLGLDDVEFDRSFFENNPIVSPGEKRGSVTTKEFSCRCAEEGK